MDSNFWKWVNRIFFSGIWLQPIAFTAIRYFFKTVLQGDISFLLLLFFSFIPTIYVWSENQRRASSGQVYFGIEDTFHNRPTEYSSPLKMQAMYPQVDERFLFDVPQGVVLGRIEDRKQTRYLCKPMDKEHYRDGHVLIFGGSGSGKSSSIIIPTLLSVCGIGIFCVDIKGELWKKTRRMDEENVVIIDFQDRGKYGWDALYALNHKSSVCDQDIRECMEEIANSLIPIAAKDSSEFWKQSARSLLTGELCGLYKQKKIKNLSEMINEILSRDTRELVTELMDGARPKAVEVKYLSSFRNLAEETLSGVVQQMEESLKVFIDEDIRYAFEANQRKANPWMLEEKKEIFLAVREEKLEAYYNVINLMIAQVFAGLIKRPEGAPPVLVIVDELARFCARGQIPYLHNGILLTGRSRNVTLMLVTQSCEALYNAYTKNDVQSMIANCAYLACLDVRSQETAKTICSLAGNYKEREKTWSGSGKNRSVSVSYRERPILEMSDLNKLVQMDEIVLISAEFFYNRVKKCPYFRDDILSPLSLKAQRYNREALGIEGEEFPVLPVAEEKKNMDARMDCLLKIWKEKSLEIYGYIKRKWIILMDTYNREDMENEKKRNRKHKK